MSKKSALSVSRRRFLAATGGALAAGPVAARGAGWAGQATSARPQVPSPPAAPRKLPLGVFDPVYKDLSLEQRMKSAEKYVATENHPIRSAPISSPGIR